MARLLEAGEYISNLVLIAFLLVNFDLTVGTIYLAIAIADIIAYQFAVIDNRFRPYPIERSTSMRWINLVWAMGAYVAFIFLANFITLRFGIASGGDAFSNVSQLISETFSATPILGGSTYLKLAVWGIVIPIVETKAFFRTWLQWGIHAAKVSVSNILSFGALGAAAFFGAIFALFHLVAKGITNNAALMVTFLFGIVSVGLVLFFKEATHAIFLHIITNTVATMKLLGVGFFQGGMVSFNAVGFMWLGGVILVSWVLLFQQIPLVNKLRF